MPDIVWQNLVNFELYLEFITVSDYDKMDQGDFIRFKTFVTMLSIEII
jgi:hypothetical protein